MARPRSRPAPAPAPEAPRPTARYSGRAGIPDPHEATARHHERQAAEHAALAEAYRKLARKGS